MKNLFSSVSRMQHTFIERVSACSFSHCIKSNMREKENGWQMMVGGQRLRFRRRATCKATRGSSKASSRVAALWQCRNGYPSTVASSTTYYHYYYQCLLPPACAQNRFAFLRVASGNLFLYHAVVFHRRRALLKFRFSRLRPTLPPLPL